MLGINLFLNTRGIKIMDILKAFVTENQHYGRFQHGCYEDINYNSFIFPA